MAFKLFPKDFATYSRENRRRLMWILLFVLCLVLLVILYLNFWRSSSGPLINIPGIDFGLSSEPTETSVEGILEGIDFDDSFLKDSRFLELKSYGEWPLDLGQKGRSNPFLP